MKLFGPNNYYLLNDNNEAELILTKISISCNRIHNNMYNILFPFFKHFLMVFPVIQKIIKNIKKKLGLTRIEML